jgi:lysyl endopeptidase
MIKGYFAIVMGAIINSVFAQVASFRPPPQLWYTAPAHHFPIPNRAELNREDEQDESQGLPPRFGVLCEGTGTWTEIQNAPPSIRIRVQHWRLLGADGIIAQWDSVALSPNAKLWVSNGKSHFGYYTAKHKNSAGGFAAPPLEGDSLLVILAEPNSEFGKSELHAAKPVYLYRYFSQEKLGFGSSGACNIDVACPEAMGTENIQNGVVMMLTDNNTRKCSGVLINNTAENGDPYILTARHCNALPSNQFLFSYRSSECGGADGNLAKILQGCTIISSATASDFSLLRLQSSPPVEWQPYWAGWDRNEQAADSSFCLHHPAGDVMKFSKDRDSLTSSGYLNAPGSQPNYWRVGQWELGTTQGGSSGSALFNPAGKVIGQLRGGYASCSNMAADYYGKFSVSWDGSIPSQRLKDWLDPAQTQLESMNGGFYNVPGFALDGALMSFLDLAPVYCLPPEPKVRFRNQGTTPAETVQIDVLINGSFHTRLQQSVQLNVFEETYFSLKNLLPSAPGHYEITLVLKELNGIQDDFALNDTLRGSYQVKEGLAHRLLLKTDFFPAETAWEIMNLSGEVLAADPSPASPNDSLWYNVCLPPACYQFIVYDTEGDGICCQYGFGFFTLFNPQGDSLTGGAEFESEIRLNFCTPTPALSSPKLNIYPNPSQKNFRVFIPEAALGSLLKLSDSSGRIVQQQSISEAGWLLLSLSDFVGVLTLTMENASGSWYGKAVVIP